MIVTLTGASGFIGRALAARLSAAGHEVRPVKLREAQAVPACDAVVHLAGETVAQRWTAEAKQRIRASRTDGTRRLIGELEKLPARPRVFVCASAIGFYGSRGDEILDESSERGDGFLAEVCVALEQAADRAAALGMRAVKLRIGIVLGLGGGALARMLPAFRLGVAGRLGSGRQWMSWVHLDDLLRSDRVRADSRRHRRAGERNRAEPGDKRAIHGRTGPDPATAGLRARARVRPEADVRRDGVHAA